MPGYYERNVLRPTGDAGAAEEPAAEEPAAARPAPGGWRPWSFDDGEEPEEEEEATCPPPAATAADCVAEFYRVFTDGGVVATGRAGAEFCYAGEAAAVGWRDALQTCAGLIKSNADSRQEQRTPEAEPRQEQRQPRADPMKDTLAKMLDDLKKRTRRRVTITRRSRWGG